MTIAVGQVLHLPYPEPLAFSNPTSGWCLYGRSIGGSYTIFHVARSI